MKRSLVPLLLGAMSLVLAPSRPSSAQEVAKRFDSRLHLPARPLLHVSLGSVERLGRRLSETIWGRIVTHPGWKGALGGLLAEGGALSAVLPGIDEASGPFIEITGKKPLEILGLLEGEVAFVLQGISPMGPEAALAIETGKRKGEILAVRTRIRSAVEESGIELQSVDSNGIEASAWPLGPMHLFDAHIGTHLVVATSQRLLDSITAAYSGKEPETPAASRLLGGGVEKELAVEAREGLFLADLAQLRGIASGAVGDPNFETFLQVSGLDGVTTLGAALGFGNEGSEIAIHVGLEAKAGGVLSAIRDSLPAIGDIGKALPLLPGTSHVVSASRIQPGKLLRAIDGIIRAGYPDSGEGIDVVYEEISKASGIQVKDDIWTLPDITIHAFQADPPAGGFFADAALLVETKSLEPYWKLFLTFGRLASAEVRSLTTAAGKITYFHVPPGGEGAGGALWRAFRDGGALTGSPDEALAIVAATLMGSLCRADLPGGWTVLSGSSQTLVRYLEHHKIGLVKDQPLAALARARFPRASGAHVTLGGKGFLYAYNSVLSLASAFAPFLAVMGIDIMQAPPAEAFQELVKPGWVSFEAGPAGFTLKGHGILESSTGVLAGTAVVAMGAGLAVPALLKGRSAAQHAQCSSHLRQLYMFAMAYSDEDPAHTFPWSPEGSHASLQLLADFLSSSGRPELFICPVDDTAPPSVVDGRIILEEGGTSYEIVPWKLKNTAANAILIYDNLPRHDGRRNVLFTDHSVMSMEEAEFQERFAEEREKYSRPAAAPAKKKKQKKSAKQKAPREEESDEREER
ncbi:MAG TPA: hypothetical protein VMT52_01080 [Planctomycetota bacterium]|nr:hypothetical protein [Planctomycetota bacterium]